MHYFATFFAAFSYTIVMSKYFIHNFQGSDVYKKSIYKMEITLDTDAFGSTLQNIFFR